MRQATISRGGQVSIPAEVRRRWQTSRLSLEDRGDELVLRPIPADPIGAAMGSLAGPGPTTDALRAVVRAEEVRADRRRGRR
jgi:AbrB family looped-hinge helix DNA binding protein